MYCLELGGEDDRFAACEARTAASGVEVVGGGVATAGHVALERARGLAYTHRVSELVGRTDASVESARTLLRAANLDRDPDGTVAVRARDVRAATDVSTSRAERELGQVLVDRGFAVDLDDPDYELRVLFAGPPEVDESGAADRTDDALCLVGWLVTESVRDFGDRRPTDRPYFQPGGMAPLDARAFANIAGAGPDATVLDPMCGTGGVLIEAGLVGARTVGVDAQRKMVRGARENLAAYLADAPPFDVIRGDATALPIRDDAVDGVVFDAPYGRQSKIARHSLETLVSEALSEAHRVAPRAVVVADRPWRTEALDAGWRLTDLFERRVHRSLVRHVHVLERA